MHQLANFIIAFVVNANAQITLSSYLSGGDNLLDPLDDVSGNKQPWPNEGREGDNRNDQQSRRKFAGSYIRNTQRQNQKDKQNKKRNDNPKS
jgi:hypothetical protein